MPSLMMILPALSSQLFYPSWPSMSPFDLTFRDTALSYAYESTPSCYGDMCLSRASNNWAATPDFYSYKMRLPDMEPDSVSAMLSADSSSIKITGKRKFEGCTCEPTTMREVALPYRPRPEDVSIQYDEGDATRDSLLTLKLARHAKAEAAVPLKVTVAEPPKAVEPTKEGEATGTRPLRFVPHESATAKPSGETTNDDAEATEKSLTEKFRIVGKVAGALASSTEPQQAEVSGETGAASASTPTAEAPTSTASPA